MKEQLLALAAGEPDPRKRLNLVREYLQACLLRSLQDAGAFAALAFQGGTALRFLHGLGRFSDDLGFSLERPEHDRGLATLAESGRRDLERSGHDVEAVVQGKEPVRTAEFKFPGLLRETSTGDRGGDLEGRCPEARRIARLAGRRGGRGSLPRRPARSSAPGSWAPPGRAREGNLTDTAAPGSPPSTPPPSGERSSGCAAPKARSRRPDGNSNSLRTGPPASLLGPSGRIIPGTMDIEALPGGDLIREGLQDLATGRESAAALLVAIGAPRLRRAGLCLPSLPFDNAEHRLYELLARAHADSAHSRFNALIRRLVSFERACECDG